MIKMEYNYYLILHKDGDNNSIKIENRIAILSKTSNCIIAKLQTIAKPLNGIYTIIDNSTNSAVKVIPESIGILNMDTSVRFKIIEESIVPEYGRIILKKMVKDFEAMANIKCDNRDVVLLNKVNQKNTPCDIASGFLLKYKNRNFLITAKHIYDKNEGKFEGNWSIVLGFNSKNGAIIKPLELFLPKNIDIDIAFQEIDILNLKQEVLNLLLGNEATIFDYNIIEDNLDAMPSGNEEYNFWGYTKPNEDADKLDFIDWSSLPAHYTTPHEYNNITFLGEEDCILKFEMDSALDLENVRGCSGSPILNEKGKIVGMMIEMYHGEEDYRDGRKYLGKERMNGISSLCIRKILDNFIESRIK